MLCGAIAQLHAEICMLAQDCSLVGTVQASSTKQHRLGQTNIFTGPDAPVGFPEEEPPFVFVPDRFTRKQ